MESGLLEVLTQEGGKADAGDMRERLASRIAAIEKRQVVLGDGQKSGEPSAGGRVALGIEAIDRALDPYHGRGIEFAALHEIRSSTTLSFAAAAGFALVLGNHMERCRLGRAAHLQTCERVAGINENLRPVFWIADDYCLREAGEFYWPGCLCIGLLEKNISKTALS